MAAQLRTWTAIAVLEGIAIVPLGFLVFADGADAVAPIAANAAPTKRVVDGGTSDVESPAPPPIAETPRATEPTAATQSKADDGLEGTLLHGEVRDRLGAVLKDASLSLYRGDATKPLGSMSLRKSAVFAWPGLHPDSYRLSVRSAGMRTLEHRFAVPAGHADLRLDLAIEPSWLLKVDLRTPDGRPFAEAQRELQKERPKLAWFRGPVTVVASWNALPATLPASDLSQTPFTVGRWQGGREPFSGSMKLPARYAGVIDIPETRSVVVGAVVGNVVLQQVPVEPGQAEVVIGLDPQQLLAQLSTVRLQVVDGTTRAPIATAKVGLNDSQSYGQPTAVDAEGRIEVRDLLPGVLHLTVIAEGRTVPSLSVEIPAGATIDLGQVAVVEPFALRVRVSNRGGDKELNAQLTPLDAPGHGALRPRGVHMRAKGDDLQAQVTPGRYRLRITGGGGALLEFDTTKLGAEPLVVALQAEATLRLDSSALADPVQLVLRGPTGAVVFDRWITWKSAWEQLLLPGTYAVEVRSLAGQSRREELIVPADGARYVLR